MFFINRGAGHEAELRSGTFTGAVYGDRAFAGDGIAITNVLFTPSARTYWHSHGGGQLLTVDRGFGLVVDRGGDARFIEGSDVIFTPGGDVHWHGASPTSFMLHTSVSFGTTEWLEEVTEAEYLQAVEKATGHAG
jgi:quercetin dioxygenase-like cupin family protein